MSITERLAKLKSLRDNLCNQSSTWNEAFETRDWIISNIRDVITQGKQEKVTKEDIISKLEDIICVIEPDEEHNDDKYK